MSDLGISQYNHRTSLMNVNGTYKSTNSKSIMPCWLTQLIAVGLSEPQAKQGGDN